MGNKLIIGLSLLGLMMTPYVLAEESKLDEETGMVIDKHWEIVKGNCTGCHSAKQFLQQKCDRETWHEIITWMQEEQGMWELDSETESKILDYLSTHYTPASEKSKLQKKQLQDS